MSVAIAFGRCAESMSTFVDDVFAGTLVSSVICHRCHTVCHFVQWYASCHTVCMSSCHMVCHLVTLLSCHAVIVSCFMSPCYMLYVILSYLITLRITGTDLKISDGSVFL